MAVNLVEASKLAAGRNEIYASVIMELFARNSDPLVILPFETIQGSTYKYNREKTLPGIDFRGLNEAYVESTGLLGVESVTLKPSGGDVDVDTYLVRTMGQSQVDRTVEMKVKAMALFMTKNIIKGDAITNAKAFDGFQAQIIGGQIVHNSTGASGAVLSLTKLDELIDTVESPTDLMMNKTLKRRLAAAARLTTVGGYITYDLDAFGRRVQRYNDLPIAVVDKDEDNSAIIPFTEAAVSGSSVCASIYCVSTGANGVKMLQSAPMVVKPLGEMGDKPVLRTRIEWDTCVAIERELSAARLDCIADGVVGA